MFLLDDRWQIRFWNKWMTQWTGIESDRITGQSFTSVFSKLVASDFTEAVEQVFDTQKPISWQLADNPEQVDQLEQAMTNGNSAIPLQKVLLTGFSQNNLYGCLVQLTKAAYEKAVAKQPVENTDRSITSNTLIVKLNTANDPTIVLDSDNFIISINIPAEELFGYPQSQLAGKPLRLLFPGLSGKNSLDSQSQTEQVVESVNCLGDTLYLSVALFQFAEGNSQALVCRQLSDFSLESESLSHQREILTSIYQNTADGIILIGNEGYVEHINPVGREILGFSEATDAQEHIDDVMLLEDAAGTRSISPAIEAIERGTVIEVIGDLFIKTPGREPVPIAITATPLRNQLNKVNGCVVVFRSISEARRISSRLTWQSSHDALTQLPNRRFLEKELLRAIDDVHINPAVQHTLLYIDLYNFSVINDTSGHNAGDELLRQFARLLEDHFDPSNVVARIGNDEFAVLIRDKTVEEARELAEELLEEVKTFSFPWEERRLKIGLSIGAKVIDQDVVSEIDVLVAAGTSCAAAKESGRNRVNFQYRSKEIAYRKSAAEWIPRISEALEDKRFELYCQPIIPLHEKPESMKHFELLVRMRDKEGKMILPGKFIPPAEHYGLIEDIDKWVLNSIFSHQKARKDQGLPLYKYAINLSGKSIGDENLRLHILENFEKTGLDPHLFQFEITETAAIRNFDRAMDLIHTLKAEGCYFSLDDFGSGLSSLGYLKELPVDYLKIDGSFIKNMEVNEIDYSMISTVNHLGHIMGISTVAECVENASQLAMLKEIGVDYGQGYLFAKPQPIGSFYKDPLPEKTD